MANSVQLQNFTFLGTLLINTTNLKGPDLRLLCLPIMVWSDLLDRDLGPDDHAGSLLVHPGLHRLAKQAGPDNHHHHSLFC